MKFFTGTYDVKYTYVLSKLQIYHTLEDVPGLAGVPRFPLTNTTKTAAYAAQPAKTSDLFAFVANPRQAAKANV